MHTDRTNRTALIVLGFLILAAGVAGLVGSVGGFGTAFAHKALITNRVSRYFGAQGTWLWPVIAVAAALLGLLALRWLYVLVSSTDRAGELTLPGDRSAGRTTLRPAALSTAVQDEITTYRGVTSARARVLGDSNQPELAVIATVAADADLAAVRRRIETEALSHARQALDLPDLAIRLDLDISRGASTRRS